MISTGLMRYKIHMPPGMWSGKSDIICIFGAKFKAELMRSFRKSASAGFRITGF